MLVKLPEPTLNSWTIIFLFIAFTGILSGIGFLMNSKNEKVSNRFIAFILFTFSLTISVYSLFWTGYIRYLPFLGIANEVTPFLFGPLFYFYFLKLIYGKDFSIKYFFHAVPALVVLVYFLPPLFFNTKEAIIAYMNFPLTILIPWFKIAHLVVYGILIYKLVSKTVLLTEIKKWSVCIQVFYAGIVLCLSLYYVLLQISSHSYNWDYLIYFILSAFICFTAVFAFIKPMVFNGFTLAEATEIIYKPKYKTTGLTQSAANELYLSLQKLMEEEKLYFNNDLRLEILAQKLNTNNHHLSQVINEKTGMNFFDYINSLRIKEAMHLLKTKPKSELNIIEVAYMVGFNNKVSFNNAFKKATGNTPTEFRENNLA